MLIPVFDPFEDVEELVFLRVEEGLKHGVTQVVKAHGNSTV